jgi:hypothetical protein
MGLWVIALLHEKPGEISFDKSEPDAAGRQRLQKFRDKVSHGRLVKFWKNAEQLPGLVSLNLSHAMREHPAVGWVRADKVANVEVLGEINEVRKQKDALEARIVEYRAALADYAPRPALEDLAGLDEDFKLKGTYWHTSYKTKETWSIDSTWRKMFAYISPYLVQHPIAAAVKGILAAALFEESHSGRYGQDPVLDDQDFQTVGVQFQALGLVKIEYSQTTSGSMGLFWSSTSAGERLMVELRAVRTKITGGQPAVEGSG